MSKNNCVKVWMPSDLPPDVCPGLDAAMEANGRPALGSWRMAISYPFEESEQEEERAS